MTAKEAAGIIGIHRNNVLKAVREERLEGVKLGERLLIRRADAESYAAAMKRARKGPIDSTSRFAEAFCP